MGLLISIYKNTRYGDCTLNGVSSRKIKGLCITNIDAPFEPDEDYPPAKLEENAFNSVRIVPEECEGKWSMMGGNYGASSDSRFAEKIEEILGHRFYGAVAIHDRVEG